MLVANNFWGRDDVGVGPLLDRMQNAKTTCDELKAFYNARAALEDEYSRKLFALCRKPLGSTETGTLRAALDTVRGEIDSMGKQHAAIAAQVKAELEEPLAAFAGGMKERRKIVQTGIERLLKTKQSQMAHVNKSRDRYEQDCLRIKGYLAQGHMVMGQEERKNKAKLEKTQINMANNSTEYETAIKVMEETIGRWNKEWKAACDVSSMLSRDKKPRAFEFPLICCRNSRILRKNASTLPNRPCGPSPISHPLSAFLMTPRAKRSDCRWRTARSRKISQPLSRRVELDKKYQIRQGISTFAEGIFTTHLLKRRRMRTIL